MINSAEAPPSSQSAGLTLAQRLRARRWLAERLIRSRRGTGRLRGGLPVGVGAAGTGGSSAGALGSLPERQRVGDLRAAVVSPLFWGICGGGVNFSTSESIRLKYHCMGPLMSPEVTGLGKAFSTFSADAVSLACLCPEHPCVIQDRAVGTAGLVQRSKVLWNVCFKDI